MSDISKSSLGESLDAEFEKKIAGADFETIKTLMAERAVASGLVQRDAYDSNVLIPTEKAAQSQPQKFAKSFTINGVTKIIEADSELSLAQAETAFFRELMQTHEPVEPTEPTEQPRNEQGQFMSAEDAAAKVELELAFKRGDIDASTYLARSGVIASYIETHDWEAATRAFLKQHRDWPGSQDNLRRMGETIAAMGLVGDPSVESMEAAYQDLVRRNAIPEIAAQRETEAQKQQEIYSKFANARSFSEIKDASALFGRR